MHAHISGDCVTNVISYIYISFHFCCVFIAQISQNSTDNINVMIYSLNVSMLITLPAKPKQSTRERHKHFVGLTLYLKLYFMTTAIAYNCNRQSTQQLHSSKILCY